MLCFVNDNVSASIRVKSVVKTNVTWVPLNVTFNGTTYYIMISIEYSLFLAHTPTTKYLSVLVEFKNTILVYKLLRLVSTVSISQQLESSTFKQIYIL